MVALSAVVDVGGAGFTGVCGGGVTGFPAAWARANAGAPSANENAAAKKSAGAKLALPLNHAAFPRNAAQLRELGAGYTNCAPTPEARLLRSMREQAAEARKLP